MLDEVRAAIYEMIKNKSPGIDDIMAEEIQAAAEDENISVNVNIILYQRAKRRK